MKITRHKLVGDGCIWEGISLINACLVSQSVFYQVLNAASDDGVFKVEHIKCHCCPHIKTSQLICCSNQFTGFYMRAN